MKKFFAAVVGALAALALCICFAACANTSEATITGTWKFYSMASVYGEETYGFKVGDSAPWAEEDSDEKVTSDYYVFVVKEDKTFEIKMKAGDYEDTMNGTWVEKDGKYEFTEDDTVMVGTLEGDTLTLVYTEGSGTTTFVFKK